MEIIRYVNGELVEGGVCGYEIANPTVIRLLQSTLEGVVHREEEELA